MPRYFVLKLFVFVSVYLSGQDHKTYYHHFTGTLDSNMILSMDLVFHNSQIYGYYYYGFPVPGDDGKFHYGKTLPVTGNLEFDKITIIEANNSESRFEGKISNKGVIKGTWKRQYYQKEVPFTLSENYKGGSLAFKPLVIDKVQTVKTEDDFKKNLPKATISIFLLFPESAPIKGFQDTLIHYLNVFLVNDSLPVKSKNELTNKIINSYFESYAITTDGIENIEELQSFNWEKRVFSEILYNEHDLISMRFSKYAYTGGAHGISIHENHVFSLKNGSILKLSDVFKPGFEERLNELLEKKLRRLNGLSPGENLLEAGFFVEKIEATGNFFLNNDGIGFYYNVYEIAPYASGSTELFMPFAELKTLLKDDHPFTWLSYL